MTWKQQLQVRDLAPNQRLEMTCRICGHVHYLTRDLICVSAEREYLYLDEIENETVCKAYGKCRGPVRMALIQDRGTSAFVGGLA